MAHTHVPVDEPGCLSCHQPHVSETKFLLARATIEDVCLQCHLPDRDPVPHSPYGEGECTACHRPHAADSQLLLRGGDGPAHCYQCHDETRREIRELTYVHAAVEGQCTDCHAAHAAPYDHALEQPMEQMCFSCHAPIEALATQSTHTHGAVSRELACANCHESHASGRPGLLVDQEGRLCLQCHDREIETSDGRMLANMAEELNQDFLHGPVETGECHQCHEVHGSEHTGLLTAAFTDAFYAPFDLAHFELCFNCHQSALVLEERTSTLTNFRDGERNLHYLHVHRERKGRTCRTCHVVHGSDLPNHMAESVPFEGSDWAMPIGYEPTATGGACTPGCHARETYEREPSGDALKSAPEGGAS
jgi:predicted CXXCH cytochrome family protein